MEPIVQEYNDRLVDYGVFPFTDVEEERREMVEHAPYPSYHLFVQKDDFAYVLTKGDKTKTLPVKGFFVDHTNTASKTHAQDYSLWAMLPSIQTFE